MSHQSTYHRNLNRILQIKALSYAPGKGANWPFQLRRFIRSDNNQQALIVQVTAPTLGQNHLLIDGGDTLRSKFASFDIEFLFLAEFQGRVKMYIRLD